MMGIMISPCNRAEQKRNNDTPASNSGGSDGSKVEEIDQTQTRNAGADEEWQEGSKSKVI